MPNKKHSLIIILGAVLLIGILAFLWFSPVSLNQLIGAGSERHYKLAGVATLSFAQTADKRWESSTHNVDMAKVGDDTKTAIADIVGKARYTKRINTAALSGVQHILFLHDAASDEPGMSLQLGENGNVSIDVFGTNKTAFAVMDKRSLDSLNSFFAQLP